MSFRTTFMGVDTYYARPPFSTGPRDVHPLAWQCLSYKKNTTGIVPPTHTSVIFRRVKQSIGGVDDANPTVGTFTFDISHVELGEVMYIIADGDGNVANPWGVAIAFFVIRDTGSILAADGWNFTNILHCSSGAFGSNVWDGGPEIVSWNDLGVQASGSGAGSVYPVGTSGVDPDPSLSSLFDWSAFCFTAGTTLPFTQAWWVPDGAGSFTLAWPPDGASWGMPLISSSGTQVDARMFTYNVQAPDAAGLTVTPPPSLPIVAHSVTDVFFMQLLAQGFPPLGNIGTRTPARVTSYGVRDVLAERARPQFIDQLSEGGGGIWLEGP